jgi:hypothetical protein
MVVCASLARKKVGFLQSDSDEDNFLRLEEYNMQRVYEIIIP